MKNIIIVFSLINIFILNGCSFLTTSIHTIDPITGERKISNITKGVGYGAAGGASVGAAIGAGAGTILGGGAGYYIDRQEKKLREKLEKTGVGVFREGERLKLVMPSNILFDVNSTQINRNFYEVLHSITLVLNEFDNTHLKVYGFADSQGSFEKNQILSEARARSVSKYLRYQGVNPSRIYDLGLSERFPIANNNTKKGRALNRRVELNIEPVNL